MSEFFDDYDDELIVAHANCRIHPEICVIHGIKEHPSFMLYKNGKVEGEYRGPRVSVVMNEWLKVKTGINAPV